MIAPAAHAQGDAERGGDADERQADGAAAPHEPTIMPITSVAKSHTGKNRLGRDHLKAVVNHRGNGAREDPDGNHNADAYKNQARLHGVVDALLHGIEDLFPIEAQIQCNKAGDDAADEHRDLGVGSQAHDAAEHDHGEQAEGEHSVAELHLFFRFRLFSHGRIPFKQEGTALGGPFRSTMTKAITCRSWRGPRSCGPRPRRRRRRPPRSSGRGTPRWRGWNARGSRPRPSTGCGRRP